MNCLRFIAFMNCLRLQPEVGMLRGRLKPKNKIEKFRRALAKAAKDEELFF